MFMKKLYILGVLILGLLSGHAQLRLPKLISDGMVLQRNTPLKIWGWALPNDTVEIDFYGQSKYGVANKEGLWQVNLSEMNAGGPYQILLSSKDTTIVIKDVLVGDVWLCSGQSNMQFNMDKVKKKYKKDIAQAYKPYIRSFLVSKQYNFNGPQVDVDSGLWRQANPSTVPNFSAVAYFFGLELYEKYRVPIGLIDASVGGTPAQAWMSEEALKSFPHYNEEAQRCKDSAYVASIEEKNIQDLTQWNKKALINDKGLGQTPWYANEIDVSTWPTMELPGYWNQTDIGNANGVVWFRGQVNVPKDMLGDDMQLQLGRIVDADSVYVNGIMVGSTSHKFAIRNYTVPSAIIQEGDNIITIRVANISRTGGFVKGNPLTLSTTQNSIDLSGQWYFQLGAKMPALERPVMLQWKPTGLYNNMIAPIRNYALKGVVWYQGEGNTKVAKEYADLFPSLIKDWRKQWNDDKMPFLFVQLANFMKVDEQPQASAWAMLRESQLKTLALNNTGMAVAIDIGEWNDIHPRNKKDVGKRLALAAQKIAYKEDVVYSGPIYKSKAIKKGKISLSFELFGSSLRCSKGQELMGFAIAGTDNCFVWANAQIDGNRIVVWSDKVDKPVAVRYAWANNPDNANLTNTEGLPASPFRTDNWEK